MSECKIHNIIDLCIVIVERSAVLFCVFFILHKFLNLPPSNSPNGCLVTFEREDIIDVIVVEEGK